MAKRRRRRLWYEVTPRDPRLWLYGPVPSGFWQQRANRRRYLDWLGTQLGYQHQEDWARLRVADVLHYRGKGLLKHFQSRIEPLVKEYLADRHAPTMEKGVHTKG
jgi:hypothetical protein